VTKLDVMLPAADLPATLAWYRALGFELTGQHEADGVLDWVGLTLGGVHVMLVPGAGGGRERASLWLRTSRLDELYALFEQRQLEAAAAALDGVAGAPAIRFGAKLHDTHYGTREFHLIDPNGYALIFVAAGD
jgi:catechol 2,3-dioxygenase-like lactoylglutathione lyase family enzyme